MNNYEYLNKIITNQEEQEKLKQELKKELYGFILTAEEQGEIISTTLENALKSYKSTNPFPFIKHLKIKLKKAIEEKYFTPSTLVSIDEQKIIKLYLTDINNSFLTEEEIRKRLQIDSKAIYHALIKLENENKEELEKLFPNYKHQIKKRKKFFKSPVTLSEQDLLYIGYYIGEINDLCLDIEEIAKLENKNIPEIKKELTIAFNLLKDTKNLQLVLEKYPNSEKMLEIKATNLGVKLTIKKEISTPSITTKTKKEPIKSKNLLSETEQQLIDELQKYPYDAISLDKIAKNLNKSKQEISNIIYRLKKKCQNQEVKSFIEKIIPNFLNLKAKRKRSKTNYKNETTKTTEKKGTKKIKKPTKKAKTISKNHLELLTKLAKNPNISYKDLAQETNYKNSAVIGITIKNIRDKCQKDPNYKKQVIAIYPNILSPKKATKKKHLTPAQIKLLEELNKHKENPISYRKLAELTSYKNYKVIYQTIRILRLKSKENPKLKDEIESIYPEFLEEKKNKNKKVKKQKSRETNSSTKISLKANELTVLQGLYLITPPSKTYTTQQELAKELSLTTTSINNIKKRALDKIDSYPTVEEQVKESWPSFTEDRIIKENYTKKNSISVNASDLENIKSFIRQYDIPGIAHEQKKNAILNGIHNLEESTFKSYVVECTEEQKAILALRLGYINAPLDSKSIAEIFKIDEEEVITLTKNCLQSKKTQSPQKTYQKKES